MFFFHKYLVISFICIVNIINIFTLIGIQRTQFHRYMKRISKIIIILQLEFKIVIFMVFLKIIWISLKVIVSKVIFVASQQLTSYQRGYRQWHGQLQRHRQQAEDKKCLKIKIIVLPVRFKKSEKSKAWIIFHTILKQPALLTANHINPLSV